MDNLIVKRILHSGKKVVKFVPGTKVIFHFQTTKCDAAKTVIDDSRKMSKPMELIIGKQFKLEVWEVIVQKMAINEVAVFTVDKSLVGPYPFVSKTLRESGKPNDQRSHHCCGVTLQNEGIGYDDLNDLIKHPQNLEFTIELLQAVQPTEYEKESWQMTEKEKLDNVPVLREKGNALFRQKNYEAASEMYAKAIGIVEQLMLSEKPKDPEWLKLDALKVPLLLNYSQCKLINKEYYAVIEHCNTVLKSDPNNVKAFYKRGKAHIGAWNEKEAIADLTKAAELDKSLQATIDKELQLFANNIKERDKKQSKQFANMFTS
ncbi:aryl-hydrocarbon-interacting protein-like 1 [Trichogramma pretiosum]|uniref:aryl-hydrocarbon-interacting protein-like 1 n=1 Tax=Trichogramma pretiosum TaxID=7493 RepID=UPI0006C96CFF|nr:aryl-hydrocarbon-interacting protein-like 1 [Trichogramma pretiosum]